ncbi:Formylmethanofuran dehydrogenase subunit B [hydrothermal vent metagenome]|uniref:Formylmethanofuran dehydrogenase subunit B n=1 Tax=hydrothermal vent metagenome TaxID=652676 RepID=A0A3B1DEW7_9ZZZZ
MSVAIPPNQQTTKETSTLKVIKDATCTFCGCVCDDMELTVEDNRITKAKNACVLGKSWFLNHHIEDRPEATIDGQPVSYDAAIERTIEILINAKYPITYGLSDTTCEAQRKAVAITDWIGGNLDTTTSVCHGPSGMAFQGVGEVTCSLGEIKNRADYLIYWGCNPAEGHPRHFTRYSLMPKGEFVPNGRKDRTAVFIDVRKTKSVKAGNIFLQLKPKSDFELAWALRAIAKGIEVDPEIEQITGISLEQMQEVIDGMKKAKFGVIMFGMGLTMTRGKHLNNEAVFSLARDMNAYTRWTVKPMRGHGNVTGADNVVTWSTGYPFGVNLGRGYPRFNPGEFTTTDLLARKEADVAFIIASDPMSNFSQAARDHLATIPVIVLDPKLSETAKIASVAFTTSTYGINEPGTVYRMDDIPIPLRPAFKSPYKSDLEILTSIEKGIRKRLSEIG